MAGSDESALIAEAHVFLKSEAGVTTTNAILLAHAAEEDVPEAWSADWQCKPDTSHGGTHLFKSCIASHSWSANVKVGDGKVEMIQFGYRARHL